MLDQRPIGRRLGALSLLHLALGLIGPYVVLVPINAPPGGFLQHAPDMVRAVRLSVMALVAGGLLPIAIAVIAWPTWRERLPTLALWLLSLATVNFALQMVENAHWLTLLSVSQAFAQAEPGSAATFAQMAIPVRAAFTWAHYTHILILVAWLLAYFLGLYRTAALPRLLALAGIAAALLHMVGIPLSTLLGFKVAGAAYYGIPLAIAYLLAGLWLIKKG